jgi:hypothetical protein
VRLGVHAWDDLKRVFVHYEPTAIGSAVPAPAEGVAPPAAEPEKRPS